jgi:hydrogenase maturation protein HypF
MLLFSPDPVIDQLRRDVMNGKSSDMISRKFHAGVVQLLQLICKKVRDRTGLDCVALSGGCFQNYYLLTHLIKGLKGDGFNVLTHSQIPANDGGLSLGQAVVAAQSVIS